VKPEWVSLILYVVFLGAVFWLYKTWLDKMAAAEAKRPLFADYPDAPIVKEPTK
jgi:hypothetical protein